MERKMTNKEWIQLQVMLVFVLVGIVVWAKGSL